MSEPSDYDSCRDNLEAFATWYSQHSGKRNEAATRLQLIDRLMFDCLGWSRDDVRPEDNFEGTYTDYTLSFGQPRAVWEAKKEGISFELPAGIKAIEMRIRTFFNDYPEVKSAMEQVAGYCGSRSIPLAVVTNGHQLVAFLGSRTDAIPLWDGKTLVFPSLHVMLSNFRIFWNLLSKDGVAEQKFDAMLGSEVAPKLPPRGSDKLDVYPSAMNRNAFQTDLQSVSDLVLEDIIGSHELEKRFLAEAYCEAGALQAYALTNKAILKTRYAALFDPSTPAPTASPMGKNGITDDLIASSISRRPILLLGDVGVGKTTFIRHFIRVDSGDLENETIVLYLNLGFDAILAASMKGAILSEMERQLRDDHGIDFDSNSFVRGVYYKELQQFQNGINGPLREAAPERYILAEIEFLKNLTSDREDFLMRCLFHLAKARQKQIVIFIDNIDQRSESDQQEAFLIAQEIAHKWPAITFLALRPETYHASLSHGALTGYHPKAYTISPPPIAEVIERRLKFGIRIATGAEALPVLHGNKMQLESLTTVIQTFLASLARNGDLFECIVNLSGGNVRDALRFVRDFFGSGHVDTEKIVKLSNSGGYVIPVHEFLRSLIYGDSRYYHPERSVVVNLFDVRFADPKEHFLLACLLTLLHGESGRGEQQGFVPTETIYERLRGAGFVENQITSCVSRCLLRKLAESSSRRISRPGITTPPSLRITMLGTYHIERLISMFTYVDAVLIDTPVFGNHPELFNEPRNIEERLNRVSSFKGYLDKIWAEGKLRREILDWESIGGRLENDINKIRLKAVRGSSHA